MGPLVDRPSPGIALLVPQSDDQPAGNPGERLPLAVAESVNDRIVRDRLRRSQPNVPVLVLQLDEVPVSVARHPGLRLFFLKVEEPARLPIFFTRTGDHLVLPSTIVRQVPCRCDKAKDVAGPGCLS